MQKAYMILNYALRCKTWQGIHSDIFFANNDSSVLFASREANS